MDDEEDAKDEGGDSTNQLESHPDSPATPLRPSSHLVFQQLWIFAYKTECIRGGVGHQGQGRGFRTWKVKPNENILLFSLPRGEGRVSGKE